eukprot:GHVO01052612.1.p2 GENE.GHVO01052612.1~~GHVO01052612.1.p2  ORF type:complete len:107 (+),score=10.84 GHVO01052612.1:364-684(+)
MIQWMCALLFIAFVFPAVAGIQASLPCFNISLKGGLISFLGNCTIDAFALFPNQSYNLSSDVYDTPISHCIMHLYLSSHTIAPRPACSAELHTIHKSALCEAYADA